jgi:hypothetical protein
LAQAGFPKQPANSDGLGTNCSNTTCVHTGGFLNIRSCSECSSDADCGAKLCNPTFILSSQSGYRSCVDPGGVALGAACNKDATCTSGICAEVMIKWPALPLASALNAELMPIV